MKGADGNNAGLLFELDAILAVVLGGTSLAGGSGSVLGVIIGACVMGVIKNGLVVIAKWLTTRPRLLDHLETLEAAAPASLDAANVSVHNHGTAGPPGSETTWRGWVAR